MGFLFRSLLASGYLIVFSASVAEANDLADWCIVAGGGTYTNTCSRPLYFAWIARDPDDYCHEANCGNIIRPGESEKYHGSIDWRACTERFPKRTSFGLTCN